MTRLRWALGIPRVLVTGHHDTVWPTGSLEERPWSVTGGIDA
ncbi:hypothetical protein [Streptomyces sp. NPDC021608]